MKNLTHKVGDRVRTTARFAANEMAERDGGDNRPPMEGLPGTIKRTDLNALRYDYFVVLDHDRDSGGWPMNEAEIEALPS